MTTSTLPPWRIPGIFEDGPSSPFILPPRVLRMRHSPVQPVASTDTLPAPTPSLISSPNFNSTTTTTTTSSLSPSASPSTDKLDLPPRIARMGPHLPPRLARMAAKLSSPDSPALPPRIRRKYQAGFFTAGGNVDNEEVQGPSTLPEDKDADKDAGVTTPSDGDKENAPGEAAEEEESSKTNVEVRPRRSTRTTGRSIRVQ